MAFLLNKGLRMATGTELMQQGIRFSSSDERDMILLNLAAAPGRGTDSTSPTAPARVSKQRETYNGRTGVAVRWSPSQDNVIVAGYQVLRDAKPLDYVAIGTFYFDASTDSGLDRRYEIVAIDGDDNRSPVVAATP